MPIDYFLSSYQDALKAIAALLRSDDEVQKQQISNELVEKIHYYITQAHSEYTLKRFFLAAKWFEVILNIISQLPENEILNTLKENLYNKSIFEAVQTHNQILEMHSSLIYERYANNQYKEVLQYYHIYIQAIYNVNLLSNGSELINNIEHLNIQIIVANSHFKENEFYLATLMTNLIVSNYFTNPLIYMQITTEKLSEVTKLIDEISLINDPDPSFTFSAIAANFQYFKHHVYSLIESSSHPSKESTSDYESIKEELGFSIDDELMPSIDTPTKITYLEAALKGLKYQEALKEYREQTAFKTRPKAKELTHKPKSKLSTKTHHLRGSESKGQTRQNQKDPSNPPMKLYNFYEILEISDDEQEDKSLTSLELKSEPPKIRPKHKKIEDFDQTLEKFRTQMLEALQNKIKMLIKKAKIIEALEEYEYLIQYAKGLKLLAKLIKEKEVLLDRHYTQLRKEANEHIKQHKYIKAYKTILTLKNYAKFFVNHEVMITELELEEANLKIIIPLCVYIAKYNQLILSGEFLKAHKILYFLNYNTDRSILGESLYIQFQEKLKRLAPHLSEQNIKLYIITGYEGDVPKMKPADLSKDPLKVCIEHPKFDFLFNQPSTIQISRTYLRIGYNPLKELSQVSSLTVFGFFAKQFSESTREINYFCNHIVPICQYIPKHPVIDFLKHPFTLFSINIISLYSIKDLLTNNLKMVGNSILFYLKMNSEEKLYQKVTEESLRGKDTSITSFQDFILNCGEPIFYTMLKNILNLSIFKNALIAIPHTQYIFALNLILDTTSTAATCYSIHNNKNAIPSSLMAKKIAYGADAITASSLIAYFSLFNKKITPLIQQIDQGHNLYKILYIYEFTALLKNIVITHQVTESLVCIVETKIYSNLLNYEQSEFTNETMCGSLIEF